MIAWNCAEPEILRWEIARLPRLAHLIRPLPPVPTRQILESSELANDAVKSDRGEEQLFLSSGLIGQTVYASDGSKAGKVADVLLSSRFQGVAAVVSVGGFLWVGGKDITVPVERITVSRAEDGTLSIIVASTPDQLRSAPGFDRTALMR